MGTIFDSEAAIKLQKHYKLKDVAEMCSVSQKTVHRWINSKRLKVHRIAGNLRIPRTEIIKLIERVD